MSNKFDPESLVGFKKGKLKVIAFDHSEKFPSGQIKYIYQCKCDCGNDEILFIERKNLLREGGATSCGCAREYNKVNKSKADGDSNTHFYRIWHEMKQRCDNINFKYYNPDLNYDPRWEDYIKFKEDMLESFNEYITEYGEKNISLICSNNYYSKSTCKWRTYDLHSTDSRYWYKGNLYTMKELFDNFAINISYTGFRDRIHKAGYKNGDMIMNDSLFYITESPIRFFPIGSDNFNKPFFNE